MDSDSEISLEAPSIINGCQSIVISHDFLRRLEQRKAFEAIEKFKEIKVIAKVVVGTSNDELKEITNSNNRQNPIENWQLFSNEPVHIEIEAALKDIGVFYERQRGKFAAVMRNADNAKYYHATRTTFVRVVDLAQIVSLTRGNIQWAAKPSDVFTNKESHDKCFDRYVVRNPRDIVFTWNLYKALKRGLNKYLELPTHVNSNAPAVFKKPVVRAYMYSIALQYFYQSSSKRYVRSEYSNSLLKIANPRLVDEVQGFFQRTVLKTREWYSEESKDLTLELSKKKTDAFFAGLALELRVDPDGALPFSDKPLDWREYTAI